MNRAELKKQISEINKRIAAGDAIEVTLEAEQKSASLTVDANGARRKRKSGAKDETLGIDALAPAGESFHLDFERAGEISDAQIAEKIKRASELAQTAGVAADAGDLPKVVLTRDEAKRVWVLFDKCSYRTVTHTLTAPAGYETDLASIPRVFWSIVAPEELSLAAPVFHDLIYRCAGVLPQNSLNPFDGKVFDRKEADDLFLELMRKARIPRWKRMTAYWAVRGFAAFAWKKQH